MILGIDTSLPVMSVALVSEDAPVGTVQLEGRESRNEKLLPSVGWLLEESGVDRSELTLLGVTRGPGSFTGVRVGLATVEGLSLALGIPICAVSTHEAIASACSGRSTLVFNDAGRGEFFVSAYRDGEEVVAYEVASAGRLETLRSEFDEIVDVREYMWRCNVALAVAHASLSMRLSDRLDRYSDTTPVYVRLAEAEARLLARDAK